MQVTKFGVAVDRRVNKRDREEGKPTADFFNITCFGRTAETAANFLSKGRLVFVSGRLEGNEYTKRDGTKGFSLDVVADQISLGLDRPREDDGGGSRPSGGGRASTPPNEDEVDPFDYD